MAGFTAGAAAGGGVLVDVDVVFSESFEALFGSGKRNMVTLGSVLRVFSFSSIG